MEVMAQLSIPTNHHWSFSPFKNFLVIISIKRCHIMFWHIIWSTTVFERIKLGLRWPQTIWKNKSVMNQFSESSNSPRPIHIRFNRTRSAINDLFKGLFDPSTWPTVGCAAWRLARLATVLAALIGGLAYVLKAWAWT